MIPFPPTLWSPFFGPFLRAWRSPLPPFLPLSVGTPSQFQLGCCLFFFSPFIITGPPFLLFLHFSPCLWDPSVLFSFVVFHVVWQVKVFPPTCFDLPPGSKETLLKNVPPFPPRDCSWRSINWAFPNPTSFPNICLDLDRSPQFFLSCRTSISVVFFFFVDTTGRFFLFFSFFYRSLDTSPLQLWLFFTISTPSSARVFQTPPFTITNSPPSPPFFLEIWHPPLRLFLHARPFFPFTDYSPFVFPPSRRKPLPMSAFGPPTFPFSHSPSPFPCSGPATPPALDAPKISFQKLLFCFFLPTPTQQCHIPQTASVTSFLLLHLFIQFVVWTDCSRTQFPSNPRFPFFVQSFTSPKALKPFLSCPPLIAPLVRHTFPIDPFICCARQLIQNWFSSVYLPLGSATAVFFFPLTLLNLSAMTWPPLLLARIWHFENLLLIFRPLPLHPLNFWRADAKNVRVLSSPQAPCRRLFPLLKPFFLNVLPSVFFSHRIKAVSSLFFPTSPPQGSTRPFCLTLFG